MKPKEIDPNLPKIGDAIYLEGRKAEVVSVLQNTIVGEWAHYDELEEKRFVARHTEYNTTA